MSFEFDISPRYVFASLLGASFFLSWGRTEGEPWVEATPWPVGTGYRLAVGPLYVDIGLDP